MRLPNRHRDFVLDDAIQEQIKKVATIERFYPFLILRRLKAAGLKEAPGDRTRIRRQAEKTIREGHLRVPISERRFRATGLSTDDVKKLLQKPVSPEELKAFETALSEAVNIAAEKAIYALANAHRRYLRETGQELFEEHDAIRAEFLNHLMLDWGSAIQSYDIFIEVAREIGNLAYPRIVKALSGANDSPHKIEAITALYARACQIADEIRALISNGFADGAYARWRSLHEVQVVIQILSNGDDELSEKYLLHHDIDLLQEARLAAQTQRKKRPTNRQLLQLQKIRDDLISRFGKDFEAPYGWASALLGYKATRFSDLQARAGANFLKHHYKGASANVHASARGALSRLGLPCNSSGLLAGASNLGLSRPAAAAVHSLTLCALPLAITADSVDLMAKVIALQKLGFEVEDSFSEAAAKLSQKMKTTIEARQP